MGKCIECGLLAIRDENEVREADPSVKDSGACFFKERSFFALFCYATSDSFPTIQNPIKGRETIGLLSAENKCPKWTPVRPGKTPKEHEEMVVLEELRNRQSFAEEKSERHAKRTLPGQITCGNRTLRGMRNCDKMTLCVK